MSIRLPLSFLSLMAASAVASADVYVANPGEQEGHPSVLVFATTAIDNTAPLRTIAGPNTQLDAPATVTIDEVNGELFVVDFFGQAIRVYDLAADGDAAPLRTLVNGPNSNLSQPRSLVIDHVNDEILVVSINNGIRAFPRTASGDAVPLRTITGTNTSLNNSLSIALAGGEIFVDSGTTPHLTAGILVFPRPASGNVTPLRSIGGNRTGFHTFVNAIALDLENNEIFAQGGFGDTVVVFPRNASGNVFPLRRLGGPSTGLFMAGAIAVDPVNDRIIVSQYTENDLRVFERDADGDQPALMKVYGPATTLDYNVGIALDSTGGFTGGTTTGVPAPLLASTRLALSLRANPLAGGGSMTFEFILPAAGRASAEVIAANGRRVATIFDRVWEAGRHEGRWDGRTTTGRRLAPEAYSIRLTQGGERIVRKLVRVD
jgi:hypothetical protein